MCTHPWLESASKNDLGLTILWTDNWGDNALCPVFMYAGRWIINCPQKCKWQFIGLLRLHHKIIRNEDTMTWNGRKTMCLMKCEELSAKFSVLIKEFWTILLEVVYRRLFHHFTRHDAWGPPQKMYKIPPCVECNGQTTLPVLLLEPLPPTPTKVYIVQKG